MSALLPEGAALPDRPLIHPGKRIFDFSVAILMLAVLAPFCVFVLPLLLVLGKWRLQAREVIGARGRPVRLLRIVATVPHGAPATNTAYQDFPMLFALLDGRLSLVGPRPIGPHELNDFGGISHPRFSVIPGLFCLWGLRMRSNINYGTESDADLEYIRNSSLRGDCGILGRALLARVYSADAGHCAATQSISGIRFLNLSMDNLLDAIVCSLNNRMRTHIAFVNPDCVNIAAGDAAYRASLSKCDWVCADGIGMKIAGKLLRRPIRQNINGTDLFPRLCGELAKSGHSLYLLGARNGVAEAAANWARSHYPALKVAGTRSGYFSESEEPALLQEIRMKGAQVLLVAMGAPRQELWLERNLETSGALVGIGVGGLFDFYSGRVSRAPMWLREIGGEWVYRLLMEPGRMWRRYLVGNWVFLFRIAIEKLTAVRKKGSAA